MRRRRKKKISLMRKIAVSFLLLCSVWLSGLVWFVDQIPLLPDNQTVKTDAIVVLTGGSGRLEYGLRLLDEGKGQKLLITGVSKGVTLSDILRHTNAEMRERLMMTAAEQIILGREAVNTISNASETAKWLEKEGFRSIRLVTASYHMPRSLQEFRQAAPGVDILPTPVFPDEFILNGWWNDKDSRVILLTEYHKFLAAYLRHWLVFFIRSA